MSDDHAHTPERPAPGQSSHLNWWQHPAIAPVDAWGQLHAHGHRPAPLPAHTLRDRITDIATAEGPLTDAGIAEILDTFGKVCDAVAFAHAHGATLHGLTPERIFIGEFGDVRVAVQVPLTSPLAAGAPPPSSGSESSRFVPPEIARGAADADTRADVYSLGAILYTMLALQLPHAADATTPTASGKPAKMVSPRKRARHRKIPRALAAFVMRAMAHDPANRYATVRDLQEDLRAYRHGTRTATYRPGFADRLLRGIARHRIGTAMVAGFAALLALGAVIAAVKVASDFDADRQAATIRADDAETRATHAERARQTALDAARAAGYQLVAERTAKQRIADDMARREAQLYALARAEKFDELKNALGIRTHGGRNALADEFIRRWDAARTHSGTGEQLVRQLTPPETSRYITAFRELFATHDEFPADTPISAMDFFCLGILLLWGVDQPAEAAELFSEAIERDRTPVRAFYNRGWANWRLHRFANASFDFSRVVEIGDDFFKVRALLGRAVINVERERPQEALEDLQAASSINSAEVPPTLVDYLRPYAEGNPFGTIAMCLRAVRENPAQWDAWVVLGVIYRGMRNTNGAENAFDKATAHAPASIRPELEMIREATKHLADQLDPANASGNGNGNGDGR